MYNIEETEYGFKLTFSGSIDGNEMTRWLGESKAVVVGRQKPFYVFVDMRDLIPLDEEAQVSMEEGQKYYRDRGMERSVVILSSPVVAAQFKRIGGETGIGRYERYLDASAIQNWEEIGLKWLLKGLEPEETPLIVTTNYSSS